MRPIRTFSLVVLLAAVSCAETHGRGASAAREPGGAPTREPDVIYVPTPDAVVDGMLRMAGVNEDDVVYDLGCGDGRIVVRAAQQYGARGVGIDIDPRRIVEARQNAAQAGVEGRVELREQDLFEADIGEATVVTLYLLQALNEKLRPKLLRELKPGTRVVSHAFDMGDWKPERTEDIQGKTIYFWTVPEPSPRAAARR